jgi:hypothetical protein
VQQFQSFFDPFDSNQEEISGLRFLFLNHLSFYHTFQKEAKERELLFQSALDVFFRVMKIA